MAERLTVALDAMGGDLAPDAVVKGANLARVRHPDVHFLFFGPEDRLAPLLKKHAKLKAHSTIDPTNDVVTGEVKPSVALRQGRNSSMRRAIDAVGDGRAACAVSGGNTGALMAMAKFVLKTMPGIDRPAIASLMPTFRGESVVLDLGANLVCDARNLVQFAVMGECYARTLLSLPSPSVGLLNVGSEEQKGHEALREAYTVLASAELPMHFYGFVEGDDIAAGTVDVVVTDGFTGNVALKCTEGTSRLISEFLRHAFRSSTLARLAYIFGRGAMAKLRARLDPRRYNGAIFLGLNGIVVKSHGSTDAIGFANAIGVAIDMARHGLLAKIRKDYEELGSRDLLARAAEGESGSNGGANGGHSLTPGGIAGNLQAGAAVPG